MRDAGVYANARDISLTEWFYSEPMTQLRADMLNGVQNKMCQHCWDKESVSGTSIRHRMIDKYTADVDNPAIQYLDLKLSNECNLQCVMCDGTSSDKIETALNRMLALGLTVPSNWEENRAPTKPVPDQLEQILKLLPNLKTLKITGGEPTIQAGVLKLLDTAIDQQHAGNIELNITTNGTKFTKRFLDRLGTFKRVKFNISVDGYGSTYEYIRYPFNWDTFASRIDSLCKHSNNHFSWDLTCVPQLFNIENLHKLQTYAQTNGHELYMDNVVHPYNTYNSVQTVPAHIAEYALETIKPAPGNSVLISILEQQLNYTANTGNKRKLAATVHSLDQYRQQNFEHMLEPLTVKYIQECKKYID